MSNPTNFPKTSKNARPTQRVWVTPHPVNPVHPVQIFFV
jgi:hypothetical protein